MLETILDATKPPVPPERRHLDHLLATPFRYRPYPQGSRFRRAGITSGVWYGAEQPETAAAEMVFYRFLFYAENPETPFPDDAAEYTAFSVDLVSPLTLDVTMGVLAGDAARWLHLTDYEPCQNLAETARQIGAEVIRCASVRDPAHGPKFAVLTYRAFNSSAPVARQTWRIRINRTGAQAVRGYPRLGIEFPPGSFADDPRLAGMVWERPRTW